MHTTLYEILKKSIPQHLHAHLPMLLQAHKDSPVISVRENPFKWKGIYEHEEKIPWTQYGYYLLQRPSFNADPLLHAGAYYVQEASSMFLEYALRNLHQFEDGNIYIDLCAAPGGKSTHVASLIGKNSLLISNEYDGLRAEILKENITKWGYDNTWVTKDDTKAFGKLSSIADVLLIDAPCSGSGLFRKMPDYINDWNEKIETQCAIRQQEILNNAYNCLSKNGLLFYMTCSFSTLENEYIADYIQTHFEVESCKIPIPKEWDIIETQSEKSNSYCYRFFPHKIRGEGFFLTAFRKIDGKEKIQFKNTKQKNHPLNYKFPFAINKETVIESYKEQHYIIPPTLTPHFNFLIPKLNFIKSGIHIGGSYQNDKWIPTHEAALYINNEQKQNVLELTLEESRNYLMRNPFEISTKEKGIFLVKYNNLALGWLKNIGNRFNNYYPVNYRIRNKTW